ncbi:pentapeptide repeat-containing protein [Stenotrophomonas sp.]|uniref:pentapeptide repeat-containing protein n=1 Tax=Stenotrophomonas sp. TaxID=69392 RepID=UPI0028B25FDA|nr:pentapeptide repeat-containing protein [Stenotrophomonas sp.]
MKAAGQARLYNGPSFDVEAPVQSPVKDSLDNGINEYYSKNFAGLDLSSQFLERLEFEACSFVNCDFSDATIRNSRFLECDFTECTLNNVKLPSTRLRSVTFERCRLVDVNWTTLEWSRLSTSAELTLRDCVLTDSSFHGLAMNEMVMQSCKAHGVDFREAKLRKADLSFTDFTDAQFGRTDLTDADFTEATGFDIDVLNNVMTRSKFSRHEAARLLSGLDIEVVD